MRTHRFADAVSSAAASKAFEFPCRKTPAPLALTGIFGKERANGPILRSVRKPMPRPGRKCPF